MKKQVRAKPARIERREEHRQIKKTWGIHAIRMIRSEHRMRVVWARSRSAMSNRMHSERLARSNENWGWTRD